MRENLQNVEYDNPSLAWEDLDAYELLEVFMEGTRTGLRNRDYTSMNTLGAVIGFGVVILGLGGLVGNLAGTPVMGLPNWAKGFVLMLLPALLLHELFSA